MYTHVKTIKKNDLPTCIVMAQTNIIYFLIMYFVFYKQYILIIFNDINNVPFTPHNYQNACKLKLTFYILHYFNIY